MKPKGIYTNLEKELKTANITRLELAEILQLGINTITRRLSVSSNIPYDEAIIIRDYIKEKTGKFFELEYLFKRE